MTLDRVWTTALDDNESDEYQQLSSEVCGNVEAALESTDLRQCIVLGFR